MAEERKRAAAEARMPSCRHSSGASSRCVYFLLLTSDFSSLLLTYFLPGSY